MKINLIGYAMMALIIVICYRIWSESDIFQLKCIVSDIDGKQYCVRERSKLKLAANRLAKVNQKMQKIVNSCGEKYPDRDNIKRLVKGYNPKKIYETLPTSKYTAYSENKGEKIAFCLDTEKSGPESKLIDENTLTFVAIHELAHVASVSIGHTDEFWKNFKFLLEEAVELGVYTPIDYKNNNKRYCGTDITDNPYYDM
tara:strand:- start:35 stop:631 length:597 start_codon:yes stop_codon:yes gene_type:complete